MTLDDGNLASTVHDLVEARLQAGRSINLVIISSSMWPVLSPGDRLVIRGARAEELCLGDIVIVQAGSIRLAHRLIGRRSERGELLLITKGDNCTAADEPWPAAQFMGVAVAIERGGRQVCLRSGRARAVGAVAALLSRAQGVIYRRLRGFPCRVLRKALARVLRLVTALT